MEVLSRDARKREEIIGAAARQFSFERASERDERVAAAGDVHAGMR